MKRSFGDMINPSAVGNPNRRRMLTLIAAALVIQRMTRGHQLRMRWEWVLAAAAASYWL